MGHQPSRMVLMSSSFDDFRALQELDAKVSNSLAAAFIRQGTMATTINFNDEDYSVGFIYSSNPEKADTAHLYTEKDFLLSVGNIFSWLDENSGKTYWYIIYDYIPSVKKIDYHEYLAYECNYNQDDIHGYLLNTAKKYIDTKLQANIMEVSNAKPLLITGQNNWSINDIVPLGSRIMRVIEKDDYSTPGLIFYSLESFVAGEKPDDSTLPTQPVINYDSEVFAGTSLNIATEDGYFTSSIDLSPIITPNMVYFNAPLSAGTFTIEFKANSSIVTQTYKVVS